MNKIYILAILIFAFGVFSAAAQDLIVLRDGNMIEAKVEEISPTEIRYRRFDNLNGPMIVINKSDVFSIRYQNGAVEVINSAPPANQQAPSANQTPAAEQQTPSIAQELHEARRQEAASKPKEPILDPKKLYFSLSLDPSGFLAGGPSLSGEFTKGSIITTVHVSFPTLALNSLSDDFGMGLGAGINYFWGGRIGGFYLGGMFEWNTYPYMGTYYHPYYTYNPSTDSYIGQYLNEKDDAHNFIFALNAGYKFITKAGIYFRTGASVGVSTSSYFPTAFYYKPDISTGYIF
jgi:hypothetical protein